MEQRGVVLSAIARVLNASGSALVNVYDAVASITTGVVPGGERGSFKARLREREKKLARLYFEIGKEVALREPAAQTSAAIEAGIKLAAEYRVEIEKIKQRLQDIEEEEKAAREAAKTRARKRAEPAAGAGEPVAAETLWANKVSTGAVTEETKEIVAAAAETQAPEIDTDTAASAEPEAGEAPAGAVTEATEALENMLKSDLLKLCREKGIEANKRMTKAEIIESLSGRS